MAAVVLILRTIQEALFNVDTNYIIKISLYIVSDSTRERACEYYLRASWIGLRDAAGNVDDARRGERERPTSLTPWLTRAATDWKGTFYICIWPTITSLLEIVIKATFNFPVFEMKSLVARALRVGRRVVSLQATNRSRR